MARAIKETMYIRVNNPTLNRNIGKYNLPHLWDKVLHSIPELKINNTCKYRSAEKYNIKVIKACLFGFLLFLEPPYLTLDMSMIL